MFIHKDITQKQIPVDKGSKDLDTICIRVGNEKYKQFILNSTYREHNGSTSGSDIIGAQQERLRRLVKHWDRLCRMNPDTMLNRNFSIEYLRWACDNYSLRSLVEILEDFTVGRSLIQMVSMPTRIEIYCNILKRSLIDHIYNPNQMKTKRHAVDPLGDSDHLRTRLGKVKQIIHEHMRM